MATPKPAVRRARSAAAKEQRAAALVEAARELGLRRGVRAVTLTDITGAAGVHVSAARRYFESREEIFLHLTAEGWQEWSAAVRAGLAPDGVTARELAAVLARTLAERPLFCDLLAHAPLTLEREVSIESVRGFKLAALAAVGELTGALHAAVPALDERDALDLVAAVTALAGSLWQIAHPPPTLDQLYREDARLAHDAVEFVPRLTRLVLVTTLGLIVAHEPGTDACSPNRP